MNIYKKMIKVFKDEKSGWYTLSLDAMKITACGETLKEAEKDLVGAATDLIEYLLNEWKRENKGRQ